jgi:hypothetical protein
MFDEPLNPDVMLPSTAPDAQPRRSSRGRTTSVGDGSASGESAEAESDLFGSLLDKNGLLTPQGTIKLLTTVVNLSEKVRVQRDRQNDILADMAVLRESVDSKVDNLMRKLDNISTSFSDEQKIASDRVQSSLGGIRDEIASLSTALSSIETTSKVPVAAAAPKDVASPAAPVENPIFLPGYTKCLIFGASNVRRLKPLCKQFCCPTQVLYSAGIYEAIEAVPRVKGSYDAKLEPSVLFFSCVTNEIPGRYSDEWYKERLNELREVCVKYFPSAMVYFLTPPPRTDTQERKTHTEAVRKLLMSLPDSHNFCVIDFSLEFGQVSDLLKSDGIHLTPEGVFALAEKLDFLMGLLVKQRSFRERLGTQQHGPSGGDSGGFVGGYSGFSRARRPWRGGPRGTFRGGRPPFRGGGQHFQPHAAPSFGGGNGAWVNQHYGSVFDSGHRPPSFAHRPPNPNYTGGYANNNFSY